MFGLKIYTVHVNPGTPQAEEKPLFVKEGFNIAAFLFPALWALCRRLWVAAAFLLAADFLLAEMLKSHVLNPAGIGSISLGIHALAGLLGNDWRRSALKRRGYIVADISAADSLLRAEQRYFERYLATA
ncbi:MAG: DUF2628 domain-containing protein [Pseudomonadota bacterium]|nr:DUF2628 domain-containing protein [Pseudomonadota bacterium]MDE3038210.1 DUF2628 domain-containing protein [Pseudomonadota bacterium]